MEHKITIGIEAESQTKAVEIAQALIDIKNSLTVDDLLELRKILKEKPGIVKKSKEVLRIGRKKSKRN